MMGDGGFMLADRDEEDDEPTLVMRRSALSRSALDDDMTLASAGTPLPPLPLPLRPLAVLPIELERPRIVNPPRSMMIEDYRPPPPPSVVPPLPTKAKRQDWFRLTERRLYLSAVALALLALLFHPALRNALW
jgi:hypothetical protein